MKNIWDKFKDMASPYEDDDYDDDYDDEMDDGFDDEEPAPRFTSSRSSRDTRRERRNAPVSNDDAGLNQTAADDSSSSGLYTGAGSVSAGFSGHVMGSSAAAAKQQLVLVRPSAFSDAPIIAANLREKKGVVLNLDNVDKALARRVVDFLSGCTYAVDGSVKKVAHATYLFCPSNMEISGDLSSLAGEAESYV